MSKLLPYIIMMILGLIAGGCGTSKNTKAHRAYHSINSRYNIYYNGKTSFEEALTAMLKGYKESFTETIFLHPVSSLPKDKPNTGGPFDRAIEKGNKAIKLHSIQIKPPRKPGWRNNPKLVAFYEQEEYNPFLKHCWIMVGQSQFYNGDFLQASSTFSYIARHYATDEQMSAAAKIWQAKCYAEMDWLYEAEDILQKLNAGAGIPPSERADYASTYAGYLLKNNQPDEAIPYLEIAVKEEPNKFQRSRMQYLLGQLYAGEGLDGLAYKAFGKVIKMNPPYELEFAARIRQTEVFPAADARRVIRMLEGMARQEKNKNYVEQVYYALGNIHLSAGDTARAVAAYETGIEESAQAGMDKALIWLKLGDIYFGDRNYIKAQPCFSGAVGIIKKEYKDYERISQLSATLDELAVHAEAIYLQDSLQELSRLPESERLARIDKIIEQVVKDEDEARKQAEKDSYLSEQAASGSGMERPMAGGNTAPPTTGATEGFYFYNPQTVTQGKASFQQKWGRRTLEDDWRRKNKRMSTYDPFASADTTAAAATASSDSLGLAPSDSLLNDPKAREFYLSQIPLTNEEIQASDMIIIDGMYNIGLIYKDKLDDVDLSVESFEELERRFPENEHLAECYYQIYLMALRTRNTSMADNYKSKMLTKFPDNDYSVAIADPDYEYNMRTMDSVQTAAYSAAYTAYLNEDTVAVHAAYDNISARYPLAALLPKFMFIHALAYVQQNDAEMFRETLKAIIEKYPKADVTELAGEMLKGLLRGREMIQGGIRGMVWNMRFGDDGSLSSADSARVFTPIDMPSRLILMYSGGKLDRNRLLYIVAAYNFSHLMIKELDITFDESGPVSMLTVSGFVNLEEALRYYDMIHSEGGYASSLPPNIAVVPITDANYETLMRGKTLDEYINFLNESLGESASPLTARLRARIDAAQTESESESPEDGNTQSGADKDVPEGNNSQQGSDKIYSEKNNAQSEAGKTSPEEANAKTETDKDVPGGNNSQPEAGKDIPEATATQPESDKTSPEENNTQPGSDKISSEKNNTRPEAGKDIPEGNNTQSEADKTISEAIATQPEAGKISSEKNNTQPEAGNDIPEATNTQPEAGKTSSEKNNAQDSQTEESQSEPILPETIDPNSADAAPDTISADAVSAPTVVTPKDSLASSPETISPPTTNTTTEKPKTPAQIRKEKEREYKERQRQRAKELKEKERAYKQRLREQAKNRSRSK